MARADRNRFTTAEDPVALFLQGHEPRLLAGLRTQAGGEKRQLRGRAAGHASGHTDNVPGTKIRFRVSSGTKVRRRQFPPVTAAAAAVAVLAAVRTAVAVVVEHGRNAGGPELGRVPGGWCDRRRP